MRVPNLASIYKNGENVSPINSVRTGLSFALQKRMYQAVFCCGLLAVGLGTTLSALICEIYFSSFMELQVTVFSLSRMNIRIIKEFKLIYRISECRTTISSVYNKPNNFRLVDLKNGNPVLVRNIGKLNSHSADEA